MKMGQKHATKEGAEYCWGEEGREGEREGWMDGQMDEPGRSLITGAKGKKELHDEMGKMEECSF